MIKENISLKNYNTFGIDVKTKFFAEITSENQLVEILKSIKCFPFRVLGSGSNVLLTNDYNGYTFIMKNKGINILDETESDILIEVQAGEDWHELVLWALEKDYGGIENLALIPGSVGAAPIQNIGAYGVELNSVFQSCRALDIKSLSFKTYEKQACEFRYRSSIFKTKLKEKVIITSVRLCLQKKPHQTQTEYGDLKAEIQGKELTIQNIASKVIAIRKSKLPDPKQIGNSGSFFKNPIITKKQLLKLQKKFPEIPYYTEYNNLFKVPAGWLIEKIGYKGKRIGDAGIHKKQALVLVNYGNSKGSELYDLAKEIQEQIVLNFEIELEFEVNVI